MDYFDTQGPVYAFYDTLAALVRQSVGVPVTQVNGAFSEARAGDASARSFLFAAGALCRHRSGLLSSQPRSGGYRRNERRRPLAGAS